MRVPYGTERPAREAHRASEVSRGHSRSWIQERSEKRKAKCEPARQAKAPDPETLDIHAATPRFMPMAEGPNGADPEWGR